MNSEVDIALNSDARSAVTGSELAGTGTGARSAVFFVGRDAIPPVWEVAAGEELNLHLVVLPDSTAGSEVVVSLRIDLLGPGATVDVKGVYICPGSENVSISVDVRHLSGGCTSRQLLKGIVGGHARFSFHGRILVPEGAQKTKAYQENHSILLSRDAIVETSPQLEIYADDVECSHGATVGYLSELEQFYMRSRGIPLADARRLQILSFLSPVSGGLVELDEKICHAVENAI